MPSPPDRFAARGPRTAEVVYWHTGQFSSQPKCAGRPARRPTRASLESDPPECQSWPRIPERGLALVSYEGNVEPSLAKLQARLGLSAAQLQKVVVALPPVLGLSYEGNVEPKLGFLEAELALSRAALHDRVVTQPAGGFATWWGLCQATAVSAAACGDPRGGDSRGGALLEDIVATRASTLRSGLTSGRSFSSSSDESALCWRAWQCALREPPTMHQLRQSMMLRIEWKCVCSFFVLCISDRYPRVRVCASTRVAVAFVMTLPVGQELVVAQSGPCVLVGPRRVPCLNSRFFCNDMTRVSRTFVVFSWLDVGGSFDAPRESGSVIFGRSALVLAPLQQHPAPALACSDTPSLSQPDGAQVGLALPL